MARLLHGMAIGAALGAFAAAAAAADRSEFTNLAKSRYVHCAFYKSYETDPATGGPLLPALTQLPKCSEMFSGAQRRLEFPARQI